MNKVDVLIEQLAEDISSLIKDEKIKKPDEVVDKTRALAVLITARASMN